MTTIHSWTLLLDANRGTQLSCGKRKESDINTIFLCPIWSSTLSKHRKSEDSHAFICQLFSQTTGEILRLNSILLELSALLWKRAIRGTLAYPFLRGAKNLLIINVFIVKITLVKTQPRQRQAINISFYRLTAENTAWINILILLPSPPLSDLNHQRGSLALFRTGNAERMSKQLDWCIHKEHSRSHHVLFGQSLDLPVSTTQSHQC